MHPRRVDPVESPYGRAAKLAKRPVTPERNERNTPKAAQAGGGQSSCQRQMSQQQQHRSWKQSWKHDRPEEKKNYQSERNLQKGLKGNYMDFHPSKGIRDWSYRWEPWSYNGRSPSQSSRPSQPSQLSGDDGWQEKGLEKLSYHQPGVNPIQVDSSDDETWGSWKCNGKSDSFQHRDT